MSIDRSSSDLPPAAVEIPRDPLRPPQTVARLRRMGSFHQTRLSFARTLVRRMHREAWDITCELFDIGSDEVGQARYAVQTPRGRYTVVVFADRIDPSLRTDRVIAEEWDYTFALCEGAPDAADMERLHANVPKQEAGRMCSRDLVLSRGNKSARLFDHIVDCLAAGQQPSIEQIAQVGYLMRTTAVYGNGKFGLADFERLRQSSPFHRPFSAQMLAVYVAREFSLDLVERLAQHRNPETAVGLRPDLRRALGVGNATGLGMAPFIISHPQLVHQWQLVRETAIARVKAVPQVTSGKRASFRRLLARVQAHTAEWNTADTRQQASIEQLRDELADLRAHLFPDDDTSQLAADYPWRHLTQWLEADFSLELQELVNSLILELYPELVDDLEERMCADEEQTLRPAMTVAELIALIEDSYDWALGIDDDDGLAAVYFWYRSETKEEPRLGERCCDPGADREMPLGIGLRVQDLHRELCALDEDQCRQTVAEFLIARPDWRALVRRVQTLADYPYGEVRDNLLSREMLPIDLLRFKLSFFGASKFDPKSDRWTRITLFQGAPLAREVADPELDADDWVFPALLRDPA